MWTPILVMFLLGCCSDPVNCLDDPFRIFRSFIPKLLRALLSKDSWTSAGRMESLVSLISEEIVHHFPSEVDAPAIDKTLDVGYICSKPGVLMGLETMKKIEKIDFFKNKDGSSNISIRYHFDTLKLLFQKFVFSYGFTKEMEIEIIPKKNILLIELNVKRISSFLKRVFRKRCMIIFTRVEFTELGDLQVDVRTPGTQDKDRLKPIVEKIFRGSAEIVKDSMNESFNVEFYKNLKSAGALVCRGKVLENLVLDKHALEIVPLPKSLNYNKLCSQGTFKH